MIHDSLYMSSTFNSLSFLNIGVVWELYLLFVVYLTALFCNLNILALILWPHDVIRSSDLKRIMIYRLSLGYLMVYSV